MLGKAGQRKLTLMGRAEQGNFALWVIFGAELKSTGVTFEAAESWTGRFNTWVLFLRLKKAGQGDLTPRSYCWS